MVLCFAGVSYAATANGTSVYWATVRGFSSVTVDGNSEKGSVTVSSPTSLGAGELGATARLYRGGSLVSSKGPSYSNVKTSSFQVSAYLTSSTKGNYYASGTMYVYYNGSYHSTTVPSSPSLTKSLAAITPQPLEYELNSNGKTFGSLLNEDATGSAPDLVEVIATNGRKGYVKAYELSAPNPSTPEEAVALANNPYTKVLQVYDCDENYVIGEFVITIGGSSDE